MNLSELKQYLMPSWPDQIYIGDGYSSGNGGFRFPTLTDVSDSIEANIDFKSDRWGAVGHWAMFQALHTLSKSALAVGESVIKISEIPDDLLDYYVRQNISGDGWEAEHAVYRRSSNAPVNTDAMKPRPLL